MNNLNNPATSQGPATSESSNFPVPRSSALAFDISNFPVARSPLLMGGSEGEVKISAGSGEAKMSQSYSSIPYLIDHQLKLSVVLRDVQMLHSTKSGLEIHVHKIHE